MRTITKILVVAIVVGSIATTVFFVRGRSGPSDTELAVRKFLAAPRDELTPEEVRLVRDYIRGADIPRNRQRELVQAAFARAVPGSLVVLTEITDRWREAGEFDMLPEMVNALVVHGECDTRTASQEYFEVRRSAYIIATVGSGHKLDPYLDIEYIMRSSCDSGLIAAVCGTVKLDVLFAHREACIAMLGRRSLGPDPPYVLLRVIGRRPAVAKEWFGDDHRILLELQSHENEAVREQADKVLQQLESPIEVPTTSTSERRPDYDR